MPCGCSGAPHAFSGPREPDGVLLSKRVGHISKQLPHVAAHDAFASASSTSCGLSAMSPPHALVLNACSCHGSAGRGGGGAAGAGGGGAAARAGADRRRRARDSRRSGPAWRLLSWRDATARSAGRPSPATRRRLGRSRIRMSLRDSLPLWASHAGAASRATPGATSAQLQPDRSRAPARAASATSAPQMGQGRPGLRARCPTRAPDRRAATAASQRRSHEAATRATAIIPLHIPIRAAARPPTSAHPITCPTDARTY